MINIVFEHERDADFKDEPQIPENYSLAYQIRSLIPHGWSSTFMNRESTLINILKNIEKHGPHYPFSNEVFRAFHLCPLVKVKVIILGQDPYPQDYACGMSFSVRRNTCPLPISLKNIQSSIRSNLNYPNAAEFNTGDLTGWAKQGVLLLNACLTYHPNSKMNETQRRCWYSFTEGVISDVYEVNPKVVVIRWGNEAKTLDLPRSITTLDGIHPSGYNGSKFVNTITHFRDTNEILAKNGLAPINWSLL